jgi:hypothetical protein
LFLEEIPSCALAFPKRNATRLGSPHLLNSSALAPINAIANLSGGTIDSPKGGTTDGTQKTSDNCRIAPETLIPIRRIGRYGNISPKRIMLNNMTGRRT